MPLSLHFSACGASEQITIISYFAISLPFTTKSFLQCSLVDEDRRQCTKVTYDLYWRYRKPVFSCWFSWKWFSFPFIKGISVTWLFSFKNFLCKWAVSLKNNLVLITWFDTRCIFCACRSFAMHLAEIQSTFESNLMGAESNKLYYFTIFYFISLLQFIVLFNK